MPRAPDLIQKGLLPREGDLLILCARTHLDPGQRAGMRSLLRNPLDWDALLRQAKFHGMKPLLHWHLSAVSPESVPGPIFEELRSHFQRNLVRNLFLTDELLRILTLFRSQKIQAIPFKGPSLVFTTHGNLALREFCDLDILIQEHDVHLVKELLISQGFQPQLKLTRKEELAYLRTQCQLGFASPGGKYQLEIHWNLFPRYFGFRQNQAAERMDFVKRDRNGNRRIPTFMPEELLLVLSAHGAKHLWERLEWICCLSQLIRFNENLDWESVYRQARRWGTERMVSLGIHLACHLLGAKVPERILRKIEADPMVIFLAGRIQEKLFGKKNGQAPLDRFIFHLQAREHLRDKIRYCLLLALTPNLSDWNALRLPSPLFPLHYLLRPFRILGKHIKAGFLFHIGQWIRSS